MSKSDLNRIERLSSILVQLQSRRVVGAGEIARRFGVSVRTVYRDIRALEAAGVPVGAEPGRGYFLAEGYCLPPVAFTAAEAGALVTAGKFMGGMADGSLREQYARALDKILAAMGAADRDHAALLQESIGVFPREKPKPAGAALAAIQPAIALGRALRVQYRPQASPPQERVVEPLALFYYGEQWYLYAYCRLRKGYRSFRTDRMAAVAMLEETFDRAAHGSAARKAVKALGDAVAAYGRGTR